MKRLILMLAILSCATLLSAQDLITLRNGTAIECKVTEVAPATVSYRNASNPGGPLYTVAITDVASIVYANGSYDNFAAPVPEKTTKSSVNPVSTAAAIGAVATALAITHHATHPYPHHAYYRPYYRRPAYRPYHRW